MALIREDSYSPYVRAGGYLFRPVPTKRMVEHHSIVDEGPIPLEQADGTSTLTFVRPTAHVVGSKVPARHVSGWPYAKVGYELWISHGASAYWDGATMRLNKSTDCYQG